MPQNVWFVGTANNDDSTFTITDKVYDRAIALELNQKADYFDAPMTESFNCTFNYLESLFDRAYKEYEISDKNIALIKDLDAFIQSKFKISFGNRTESGGIDFIVTSKILRKFNSLNLPFLTKELQELIAYFDRKFGKGTMKYSIAYIRELQKVN